MSTTATGYPQASIEAVEDLPTDRIVQTFTWEGMPDEVTLETLLFEDLGDGTTRLIGTSLCDSFETRDGWLASGMETGVQQGYDKLDALLPGVEA